jgi:alpha-tubulin suppressor-like RCC1 family protein
MRASPGRAASVARRPREGLRHPRLAAGVARGIAAALVAVSLLAGVGQPPPAAAAASSVNPDRVTAVSSGALSTCALRVGGTVVCAGSNAGGVLGDGSGAEHTTPVAVAGLTDATAISVGVAHACAVRFDSSIVCWGSGANGRLGTGGTADSPVPVRAAGGLNGVTAISAGADHTCALTGVGKIACWGANLNGQLGDTTTQQQTSPVVVSGISNAIAVSAGDAFTCAALIAGAVECWGINGSGQLGGGTGAAYSATPVAVYGISDAVRVSAGYRSACAVRRTGSIVCWGLNPDGELGDGTRNSHGAAPVAGLSDAVEVAVGYYHACARRIGGQVLCWGLNTSGRLGDGTAATRLAPTPVVGFPSAASLGIGTDHSCAVRTGGGVACWGSNVYGQFGDGTKNPQPAPTFPSAFIAAPDAPTGVVASASGSDLRVAWKAPVNDGGAPIAGYAVVTLPGGAAALRPASPTSAVLHGIPDGLTAVRVLALNASGYEALSAPSVPVQVDWHPPMIEAPTFMVKMGSQVGSRSVVLRVRSFGSDGAGGSGIARWEFGRRANNGAWKPVPLASASNAVADVVVVPGSTGYTFRARATDRLGNRSGWAIRSPTTVSLVQARSPSIRYLGAWKTVSSGFALGGSYRTASTAGAGAVFTFTGSGFAFVSRMGPTLGTVYVSSDGGPSYPLDMHAATLRWRTVNWSGGYSPAGTHTLVLTCLGTAGHPACDVNGFVVLK